MINDRPLFNENYFIKNKIKLPSHSSVGKSPGNQIFHYCSSNIDVNLHESTAYYIKSNLKNSIILNSDAEILKHALNLALKQNIALEFGVCSGKTINVIASHFFSSTVYGFDSFEGLPQDWQPSVRQGDFGLLDKNYLPPLLNNVLIYKDLFDNSLPFFSELIKDTFISFLHIDCDIYSSTKSIFSYLNKNIRKNTIILFDEYFNYEGWENHEYKAFYEFIDETKLNYKYIAYNRLHQQVLVQIT